MHKCNYCDKTLTGTRDQLVDAGWVIVEINMPIKKYLKSCPKHLDEMKIEILKIIREENIWKMKHDKNQQKREN